MSKFRDDLTASKEKAQARQGECDNEAAKIVLERAHTIMEEQASGGKESCVVGTSEKRLLHQGHKRFEWKLEFRSRYVLNGSNVNNLAGVSKLVAEALQGEGFKVVVEGRTENRRKHGGWGSSTYKKVVVYRMVVSGW